MPQIKNQKLTLTTWPLASLSAETFEGVVAVAVAAELGMMAALLCSCLGTEEAVTKVGDELAQFLLLWLMTRCGIFAATGDDLKFSLIAERLIVLPLICNSISLRYWGWWCCNCTGGYFSICVVMVLAEVVVVASVKRSLDELLIILLLELLPLGLSAFKGSWSGLVMISPLLLLLLLLVLSITVVLATNDWFVLKTICVREVVQAAAVASLFSLSE